MQLVQFKSTELRTKAGDTWLEVRRWAYFDVLIIKHEGVMAAVLAEVYPGVEINEAGNRFAAEFEPPADFMPDEAQQDTYATWLQKQKQEFNAKMKAKGYGC